MFAPTESPIRHICKLFLFIIIPYTDYNGVEVNLYLVKISQE